MGKVNFGDIFGENSHDYFEHIIEVYGLKPSYNVYHNEVDEVIINEEWLSPDSDSVKANRLFKFDPNFLDLIKEESRIHVLKKALELYISIEDYENAAIVRDIIEVY
jgi:protein-arginine kinase activator protein McsA